MLILTRRIGEKVFIGKDIAVRVVANESGKLRIAIDAPDSCEILREELVSPSDPRHKLCRTVAEKAGDK